MSGGTIAITEVRLGADEERLLLEVVRSGHLAQGPMVERLERAFAELCGVRHAVAVSSGTTALVVALQVLGLQPGEEVLTSPFTFVATLNAILEAGAVARFADIDPVDLTLAPGAAEERIGARTRVLLPVHLYGQPADMRALVPLAERHGLALVEDAAQAHGATVDGRAVGSFGLGCFSFYATKNVTTGEGGVVTTDDDELADRMRLLRNQGMRTRYVYETAGHNYRLTDLQAALAIPQLERLAERNDARRANAAALSEGLEGIPGLVTPSVVPGRGHVHHQYTVRVTGEARLDRDRLAAALLEEGIATGVYYPRVVFDYPCYRDRPDVRVEPVPEAERAAREVLSLPVHPWLEPADVSRVVDAVRRHLAP